jgi:hypothetical protein
MDDQRTNRAGGEMKHFSIRDLLWATAIVAILITWWVTNRRASPPYPSQLAGVHDIRNEALIHDTNSRQYYVWDVKQIGMPLSENEALKWWDRRK